MTDMTGAFRDVDHTRPMPHALARLDPVPHEPTPEDLEQLTRPVAIAANLGDRDRQEVIDTLRKWLRSRRRSVVIGHPTGNRLHRAELPLIAGSRTQCGPWQGCALRRRGWA